MPRSRFASQSGDRLASLALLFTFLGTRMISPCSAFVPVRPASFLATPSSNRFAGIQAPWALSAESESAASPGGTRKRRRKASSVSSTPPPQPEAPSLESTRQQPAEPTIIQRPKDVPVELNVLNVKRAIGDDSSDADQPTGRTSENSFSKALQPRKPAVSSMANDDSLKQLLLDAQEMQSSELSDPSDSKANSIKNVMSTIVTVDFFVVCGFLLWFLAGIFCSTVLKDDTVQIAFNSNFQALVQPALGVLMIASIASAVMGNDEPQG